MNVHDLAARNEALRMEVVSRIEEFQEAVAHFRAAVEESVESAERAIFQSRKVIEEASERLRA
jgi:hypothetical protein